MSAGDDRRGHCDSFMSTLRLTASVYGTIMGIISIRIFIDNHRAGQAYQRGCEMRAKAVVILVVLLAAIALVAPVAVPVRADAAQ
jgi:hypothetical protein